MQISSRTLLLVEDDPDDEALTLRALKRHHIQNEIVVTRDGQEALDYLFGDGAFAGRDSSELPQFVLLDIKLPKVDGIQVLQRIRADERTSLLPVVVLTSSDEQRDIVESYQFGANSYVRKPVEFNEFMEAVQQLGLYWMLVNTSPPSGNTRNSA